MGQRCNSSNCFCAHQFGVSAGTFAALLTAVLVRQHACQLSSVGVVMQARARANLCTRAPCPVPPGPRRDARRGLPGDRLL